MSAVTRYNALPSTPTLPPNPTQSHLSCQPFVLCYAYDLISLVKPRGYNICTQTMTAVAGKICLPDYKKGWGRLVSAACFGQKEK